MTRLRRVTCSAEHPSSATPTRTRDCAGAVTFYALSHRFWADTFPEGFDRDDLIGRGLEPEFRGAVEQGYEAIDRALGELVDALPESCAVLIASDHGFRAGKRFERRWSFEFEEDLEQAGFVAAGGPIPVLAERQRLSVLDIAPLFLHLAGAAIPDDLDGELPLHFLEEEWRKTHPVRSVPAPSLERLPPPIGPDHEDAVLPERLRAMGYVD